MPSGIPAFEMNVRMGAFLNSNSVWLTVTNIALGLLVLLCCVVIGRSAIREFRRRAKEKRELSRVPNNHLAGLKNLGITMQDGGEQHDETKKE